MRSPLNIQNTIYNSFKNGHYSFRISNYNFLPNQLKQRKKGNRLFINFVSSFESNIVQYKHETRNQDSNTNIDQIPPTKYTI